MDDKDDDKKRVLTPPSEWAEGMKPTASSKGEEIDESTDWLEDDDFEVPPASERSTEEATSAPEEPSATKEPSADEVPPPVQPAPSNADALLTDHGEAQAGKTARGSKLPWVVAIAGFVVAGGMGGLWLDTQETAAAEIAELKDTIRSIKRSDNKQAPQDSNLTTEYEALQGQIDALQKKNTELASENEALKKREADRAQRAIEASTKPQSAEETSSTLSPASNASSAEKTGSQTKTAPPNQVGGSWFVNLESHKARSVAGERIALLRTKVRGINLSIANATVNGQTYYRVRAAGFASKADATAASKDIAQTLNAGPFWVGKDSKNISQTPAAAPPKRQMANQLRTKPLKQPTPKTAVKKPVQLRSLPMRDNWFVFVDTYDSGQRADEVISTLNGQGLDAKVAVESRSGALFYRVQIVGIESEATGNTIVSQLRADEFKNARLRKTVN